MLIRKIEEVDYQDVYQLVKYELGYQNLEFNKFCWRLDQMLQDTNYQIYVAIIDYRVVGIIGLMLGWGLEIEGKIMRIIALAVEHRYQGQKIGSSLIAYSEQYALSKQVSAITVNSGLERRRAHEFYRKNDYYKKGYSFIKKCE